MCICNVQPKVRLHCLDIATGKQSDVTPEYSEDPRGPHRRSYPEPPKCDTSINVPLLRPQSLEEELTMSREIELAQASPCRHRSGTFMEVAHLVLPELYIILAARQIRDNAF